METKQVKESKDDRKLKVYISKNVKSFGGGWGLGGIGDYKDNL